jgi:Phosphotransacetylase
MTFLADVRARAARSIRRIVFPETNDERTRAAVVELHRLRIVEPILILDPSTPETHADIRALGLPVRDPSNDPLTSRAVERLLERRGDRLTKEAATDLVHTPLFFADALVADGQADGCVAGATHTTGDVLRAALWTIGPRDGVRTVSSAFYMVVRPFRGGAEPEVLTFTDCAVVRYPSAVELADIAIAAAADRARIVGDEPLVAFLSFSTRGSAAGPSVDSVRAAVAEVRSRAPHLAVDGELQGDAALASLVAPERHRTVRCRPGNVLVFPSLDAGTSRTNWCSGWLERAPWVRSFKACGTRAGSVARRRCR